MLNTSNRTKPLTHLACGLCACGLLGSAQATTVLLDNFTDPDATALSAHTPDIVTAGAWTGSTSSPIVGNAIKLTSNGNRANIGFTAVGAGQVLTLTFETLAGTGFGQSNGQGFELALRLADGTAVFAIGDHRIDYRGEDATGGQAWPAANPSKWVITDTVNNRTDLGYNTMTQNSGSSVATVAGTFTYTYDTGAWTLLLTNTTDSNTIWSTNGTNFTVDGASTYAPANQALAQFSMNRESARAANLDWVQVDIVPEPSAFALLLGSFGLLIGRRRR